MKVICIDNSPGQIPDCPLKVKEGDIFEVEQEIVYFGQRVYVFVGYPDWGFHVQFFIPLSDIDETEFNRNYKTETV